MSQARVVLAGLLYRAALREIASRRAAKGAAPLSAEEKMRLHARVEEAAWALPESAARAVEGLGPDDPLPDDPDAKRALREAVESAGG